MGGRRGAYTVLVVRLDGRRPIGRLRDRWEAVFKMNLQEFGWRAWTRFIWPNIGIGGRNEP
jgi:hypothetical protein